MSHQDDSFFGPSAGSSQHDRARSMFGLPGDPTARRGAPTQFDEDYSYEEESYAYPVREVEAVDMGDESEYATAHGRGSAGHQGASFAEPSSEYGFEDSMDQHDHAHEHGQTHAHSLSHAQHTEAGDTTYPESDASSYVDPDEDPHAWETRLDELAGLEEMNEREARSLRWGPSIYPGLMQARRLNNDDFWLVLENHLNETEWRFTNRVGDRGVPGIRPNTEQHPIRVLGRNFVAAEAGQHRDPGLALRQHLLDSGYGSVLAE